MRSSLFASFSRDDYRKRVEQEASRRIREAIDMSVEEPDYKNWSQSGGLLLVGNREFKEQLMTDSQSLRAQAYRLYYTSPHVRNIIRTQVKFVFGSGAIIELTEENEDSKKKAQDYLKSWQEQNKWKIKQKEIGTRSFRDGECFVHNRDLGKGKVPRLEFVEPDSIDSANKDASYGILMDPKDPTKPKSYFVTNKGTKDEIKIGADRMVHFKLNVDSTVKRGRSSLEPVISYVSMYNGWLKDRIILNKVRTSIALVRTVSGSEGQVRTIRNQGVAEKKRTPDGKEMAKVLRPGSILTASEGIKYEMLAPNINASDVAGDGRSILLAMAVGVGFPEMFLTGDFSNANFASTAVAQNPLVREFQDWEEFFGEHVKEIVAQVLQIGKDNGDLPDELSTGCDIKWPPLIQKDLVALVTAMMQLYNVKGISKSTLVAESGFDYLEEKKKIFDEEVDSALEDYMLGGGEEDGAPSEEGDPNATGALVQNAQPPLPHQESRLYRRAIVDAVKARIRKRNAPKYLSIKDGVKLKRRKAAVNA